LIHGLKYATDSLECFFAKWNKDKVLMFYSQPRLKLRLYLKGHGKRKVVDNYFGFLVFYKYG
jgi:hypothetical protein